MYIACHTVLLHMRGDYYYGEVSGAGDTVFPYVFNVAGQYIERGLCLEEAMEGMEREQDSGLGQVYAADSEAVLRDSNSLRDYRLYRAGFALTVSGIRGMLKERGEPMPHITSDAFTVRRYAKLAAQWQEGPDQYELKLALLRDERRLMEAVGDVAPIDPYDSRWGGDYIPLYDGAAVAYLTLSEAKAYGSEIGVRQ